MRIHSMESTHSSNLSTFPKSEVSYCLTRPRKVLELHLRIFPRENHALRACAKRRANRLAHILRRGLLLSRPSRHININPRINSDSPTNSRQRPPSFFGNVIG